MSQNFYFEKNAINRASHLRQELNINSHLDNLSKRFVLVCNGKNLFYLKDQPKAVFFNKSEITKLRIENYERIFLGVSENTAFLPL